MKPFMDQDFLLENDVAKKLYHEYAENMPIYDYHCHISPRMIYENHQFENIGELMLGGDHYKWRVMLSNGVDEKFIRGDASWHDKWLAFAASLKYCIGNPMFHWTHLELRRVFGIEDILSEKTAEDIKKRIGCAYLRDTELAIGIKGKHYITGMPITDEVNTTEIYLAMREHLESIAEGVRSVLEVTPPELAGDIAETGILLTGGGALLDGMDKLIEKRTGVHVIVPDDPLECVALGTGYATEHLDILENNGGIFKTREEITGFKD